jgi:hypothetical protein
MTVGKRHSAENFVDGDLLQKAANGHREAIQELAGLAADHLRRLARDHVVGNDDLTPFALNALQAMSNGATPNEAFGWNQGRRGNPGGGNELRDFAIRSAVQTRMRDFAERIGVACLAVAVDYGEEFEVTEKRIAGICRGLTLKTELHLEGIFPVRDDKNEEAEGAESAGD